MQAVQAVHKGDASTRAHYMAALGEWLVQQGTAKEAGKEILLGAIALLLGCVFGNKIVPCAVPACAMVLPADKLAWPACGQPCLCVNRTVGQKLTGTGCIDG